MLVIITFYFNNVNSDFNYRAFLKLLRYCNKLVIKLIINDFFHFFIIFLKKRLQQQI